MLHFSMARKLDNELARAVAPSHLEGIFGGRVLRVMNQEVRTFNEFGVSLIRSRKLCVPVGDGAGKRFMVAAIHDRGVVWLQTVYQGQCRMIHILSCDLDIVDLKCPLKQVMIPDGCAKLVKRDR